MQKSQSALSQQLMILSATLLCLVFTRLVLNQSRTYFNQLKFKILKINTSCVNKSLCFVQKRMRYTALPKSRSSSFEPFPSHLLRSGHFLNGRVRRFRSRHLAFPTLHGRYDLHSTHRSSYSSTARIPSLVVHTFLNFIVR